MPSTVSGNVTAMIGAKPTTATSAIVHIERGTSDRLIVTTR